jgi:hypothetical protein
MNDKTDISVSEKDRLRRMVVNDIIHRPMIVYPDGRIEVLPPSDALLEAARALCND